MIFLNNVALASGNEGFLSQVIVIMLGVFAAAYFLKGDVQTGSIMNTFILSVVIVILNKTLGAILDWFATPINFISLGFFSFIIDAFIIQLASRFLSKFSTKSFWTAVLMAIIIAIVTVVVEWVF